MGALTPVITGLTTLTTAISAADRLIGVSRDFARDPYEEQRRQLRAQQDLALRQLSAQQAQDEAQRQREADLERQTIAANAQDAEQKRRAALRRAVARQRAQFGGSGLQAGDGSAEAVLLGLFEESEQDRATGKRLDALRYAALDQSISDRQALNVLQRTQLQERQALARLASA
ncbi:MAG: transporter [Micavibrio aeruginosavorus]|uniref:Transporter n=1 Tax=Micavibrio aeruginosavorus TaxID=349221 RepID=A0A7T5R202_9BACT|nr:MAG: transporter [Micavibrio aeruginosavorus]